MRCWALKVWTKRQYKALRTLNHNPDSSSQPVAVGEAPPLLLWIVGASIAILVTNLYFAQSLIAVIAPDLGIQPRFAGAVVSASQFGYGLGLFLLVPLADMVENRRLVLVCGLFAVMGTFGLAIATSATVFLCCAFVTGVFSSGAQVLVPYLSHALPVSRRGRVLGIVMAGVLLAVMLARPYSLFVASTLGWRAIYILSACATLALGALLWVVMPERRPVGRMSYLKTITSMFVLFAGEHRVHRRAVYQALIFSAYTMFWATLPIMLGEHFGLSKNEIAVFTLVGIGGVVAVLLAGRWADHGSIRTGTLVVSLLLTVAFLGSMWAVYTLLLLILVVAATLIDGAVHSAQTFSRLVVLESEPEHRGRVNALYMTIIYMAGALGSIIGVSIYVGFGWVGVALLGAALALVVAICVFVEQS